MNYKKLLKRVFGIFIIVALFIAHGISVVGDDGWKGWLLFSGIWIMGIIIIFYLNRIIMWTFDL